MKTFRRYSRSMIGALTFIVLAIVVVFAVYAQNSNTIQGCYSNGNGSLRRVNSPSDCNSSETPISWNIIGPQGSQGIQGATGPAGPQGPPGIGTLRLIDSVGNEVGTYQEEGIVIRRNDSLDMWLRFHVTSGGFVDANSGGFTTLVFTTTNCTGTVYMQSDPSALVQKSVVFGDTVYQPSNTHVVINYHSWRYSPVTPCDSSSGTVTASQPITYPVSSFGLAPPFRLVR